MVSHRPGYRPAGGGLGHSRLPDHALNAIAVLWGDFLATLAPN
jgi:hypothetical protein